MSQELEACLIRVCDAQGGTRGTGFVVSDTLAVTCAHVVAQALGIPLNGRREEAVAVLVAALVDGDEIEPESAIGFLVVEVRDRLLEDAREVHHTDWMLDLLLLHRYGQGLEATLPDHTAATIRALYRMMGRRRGRRR